jgi:hypothetical protein
MGEEGTPSPQRELVPIRLETSEVLEGLAQEESGVGVCLRRLDDTRRPGDARPLPCWTRSPRAVTVVHPWRSSEKTP